MLDINTKLFTDSTIPLSSSLQAKCPNIKDLFIPDPSYIIFDADLEQADAQIVAWEASDPILKEIFKNPSLDLHTENAKMIFGSCPEKSHPNRKRAKAGVHATNYGVGERTLAKTLGITVRDASDFIKRWFEIHPNIKEWQKRIKKQMESRGWIENAFGNRKYFFGDVSTPTTFSEALAWIPQSTVGLVINRAWDILADSPLDECQILLQVHDSIVGQVRKPLFHSYLPLIKNAMLRPIPYPDPLIIGSSLEVSDRSWGRVTGISWDGYWLDDNDVVTDQRCTY